MTISAKVLADSISPEGIRLTTFELRYPRFIHSEFMTHRVFSRNASSSRAIPVKRMIEDLRRDPAMPVYWGSNKPGMQAGAELTGRDLEKVQDLWIDAMKDSIYNVDHMMKLGLHKQIANRILEPWAHINVVCTATDYANFFALRAHPDAQPEIKVLAEAMMAAQKIEEPNLLEPGQWHLPYVMPGEILNLNTDIESLKKISVARCARVSYLTHDGRPTSVEEDLALYEKLLVSQPLHASPAEHQATPDTMSERFSAEGEEVGHDWDSSFRHGNLRGWIQFRKTLPNEFVAG